ncbi:MAG: hydroxyacid dehydrogenase [Nitrospirota bacterium]
MERWECQGCTELNREHTLIMFEDLLNTETAHLHKDAEIISTFIYSDLSADVLKMFPALKMIATRSTGFDHIDVEYCKTQGIKVCNVPSYGEHTVAEHVFGLLLNISHKIWHAIDRTRKGDFSLKGLKGFDLNGKTLGVIGTGSIGRCVIQIARGFNMRVIAYDVHPDRDFARRLEFEYLRLEELLSRADIITIHVPENEHTRNMISDEEFEKMQNGVVLLNTARGSIVNVKALIRNLAGGRVAAAGLDVLPEEPVIREEAELIRSVFEKTKKLESLLSDHILLRLSNVYITPHSAFYTGEALTRIVDTTVSNISSFLLGKPENVVSE